jgi:hypothetical protein
VQNRPKPRVTFQLRGKKRRGGAMMSGPPINGSSKTVVPFKFLFIVLLHGRGAFFHLQPSSPSSTSILIANFIPHQLQLHPSSPTSTLVAFNFNTRCLSICKPCRFSISSPSP